MARTLDAREVQQHNTVESCWVILYGYVYDVTDLLSYHPGGPNAILRLAGRDATAAYDPVHPPGTLEEYLRPEARLGKINPSSLGQTSSSEDERRDEQDPTSLDSLLNLDDVEELATKAISKKAWAFYFSAADDLVSKKWNNEAYRSILLRPRIFIDCERCNTSTTLLGHRVGLPVYASPTAAARFAHPTGEAGIGQACGTYRLLQLISNNASQTPEEVVMNATPGQVFGFQLYAQVEQQKSERMLARVNQLADKVKFVCLTLDAPTPGKREHDERAQNAAASLPVTSSVQSGSVSKTGPTTPQPRQAGIGRALGQGTSTRLTWDKTLPWLTKHTSMPIVLKGIQTHEDAYLASLHAPPVRAIILSNHGGRALDTAPPAVHTLLEIRKYCPEVFEKLEVWVDGGIRRGTDVVKALCLGARGVGIGRAALWGLGAGGPKGVERTFEILKSEMETCMRLLGVNTVAQLGPQHVSAPL
ncbi:MAG: hypothetical protein M1816_001288 [Peltula sp. TS41687]|nr:MAG: hypothetical protein M1816_001288 [Peltula sp. TS41687]